MRLGPYLCLGGVEIANAARTTAYGSCLFTSCPCAALDATFVDPATDPAPWYEAGVSESEDFLGFLPETITLSAPYTRSSEPVNVGQFIGPEKLGGQVLDVRGWMVARTQVAMYYGERWLTEALRGSLCTGSCASDELTVLSACREEGTAEELALDFRRLVGVGASAPLFAEIDADASWVIGSAQFQLSSSMPYLYTPTETCEDFLYPGVVCSLQTPEWGAGGTFRIELENAGNTEATDIVISGQISLDGSCPTAGAASTVPPSWTYAVTSLEPEERLVIDGTRRQVLAYDPSDKFYSPGFSRLDLSAGPMRWPDVGACTQMCVSVDSSAADVYATVDGWLRQV